MACLALQIAQPRGGRYSRCLTSIVIGGLDDAVAHHSEV